MIKVEQIQYVSNIMVNVKAMQLSSDLEKHCSSQNEECSEKLLLDNQNCSLPFDTENNKSICKTYYEGFNVLRERLDHIDVCQKPCLQSEINYKEKTNKLLLSLVRPKYAQAFIDSSEDVIGYVLEMPKNAKLTSYTHEYSLPVALGYFGSIAGIFLGISLISLLTWLTNYTLSSADIKKCFLKFTQIAMTVYLAVILILLVNKYMKYPQDTSVRFTKTTSDFSITICSSLQIYGVIDVENSNGVYVSHDMFLMKNETFWLKWSNPRNIIDTLKVNDGSSEIDLLDENLPTNFSFLPIDNETVAACHTFQLTPMTEIDSLTLIYNEEVQVYFHNTGQLLYEFDKQLNLILPTTNENVQVESKFSLNVYDTAVILNMERQIKLGTEDYQSYDKCVIDYGTEELGDDLMECFFGKGYNNCMDIISKSSLTNIRNLLQSQNKCSPPQNILLSSADKSVSLDKIIIKTGDEYSDKNDLTGSLGVKDNSQAGKPKIEFFFPKFTKLSQVSLFL